MFLSRLWLVGGWGLGSTGIHRHGDGGLGDQGLRKTSLWLSVCESLATGTSKACWEYNPGFAFSGTNCANLAPIVIIVISGRAV